MRKMVGAVGIEPTTFKRSGCVHRRVIIFNVGKPAITNRTRLALFQLELDRSGVIAESQDSPVYSPSTVYGRPGVCSRGRSCTSTQDFHVGRDSLPSVSG